MYIYEYCPLCWQQKWVKKSSVFILIMIQLKVSYLFNFYPPKKYFLIVNLTSQDLVLKKKKKKKLLKDIKMFHLLLCFFFRHFSLSAEILPMFCCLASKLWQSYGNFYKKKASTESTSITVGVAIEAALPSSPDICTTRPCNGWTGL